MLAQISQVSAVESYPHQLMAFLLKFSCNDDSIGDAAFQSIIGIDQKDTSIGKYFGKFPKGG